MEAKLSFKKLIEDSIDLAFNLIGDLAETGALKSNTPPQFDFNTGVTTTPAVTETNVRIVELDAGSKSKQITKKQVLIETTDLKYVNELVIKGVTWQIGNIITQGRFVTLVEVFL
jgi:hypothetical protein